MTNHFCPRRKGDIMSFNRKVYDECSYKSELERQSSSLSYVLDPVKYQRCDPCRHQLGLVGGNDVSTVHPHLMVDLESDLRGQTRPVTHCDAFKYIPKSNKYTQGIEYIKPVVHPRINTKPIHLPACQMIEYKPIPKQPALDLFRCPK
jgi:hypothetical protein